MWSWRVWVRVATVLSGLWTAGILIASIFWYNFHLLMPYSAEPGPAFFVLLIGTLAIWIFCIGIPWIAGAANRH